MLRPDDCIVTVATGYGFAETAVTVSFLEGHGIPAVALPYQLASVSWDMTVALGGMEIRVPARLADVACFLLAEDAQPAVPDTGKSPWTLWPRRIALVLICLLTQVPPPPRGICVVGRAEVAGYRI